MGKIDLAAIANDLADTEVPMDAFGVDESLSVTYRPSAYTPELESKMAAAAANQSLGQSESVIELLLGLLVSWGLTNGDQPVPLTAEAVSKVPVVLLVAVMNQVGEHMAGKAGMTRPPR